MERLGALVKRELKRQLARRRAGIPAPLIASMAHTLLAPAKCLRPALAILVCKAAGGSAQQALPAAQAVELVHTYSLIHDDLPCMDNGQVRRGRPASHKVFGEAGAVLAGDALLTLAFELLTEVQPATRACALAHTLARAAGAEGMVGGQMLDLALRPRTTEDVDRVHLHKTAALFEAACRMGAISAGATSGFVEGAGRFGRHLGLAFQVSDDLLDLREGTTDGVSFAALFGERRARRRIHQHAQAARAVLPVRGRRARPFLQMVDFVVGRTKP